MWIPAFFFKEGKRDQLITCWLTDFTRAVLSWPRRLILTALYLIYLPSSTLLYDTLLYRMSDDDEYYEDFEVIFIDDPDPGIAVRLSPIHRSIQDTTKRPNRTT